MPKAMKIVIITVLVVVVAVVIGIKKKTKQAVEQVSAETGSIQAESKVVNEQNLPRLIDLGADKCVPCKMMAPILEEIKEEYKGRLNVLFIDVWKNPDQAKKYNVKIIPTQIFYDATGKELFRHEGFYSKEEILGKYKELGIDLQE